jgi:predicted metal-binding membrane protein
MAGPLRVPMPDRLGRVTLLASVGALAGLAWLVLVVFEEAAHSVVHLAADRGAASPLGQGPGGQAWLFLAGWTLMCVAMMLPTSLPVLAMYQALTRGRRDSAMLVTLVGAGYLVVWAGFGVVVYGVGQAIRWWLTLDSEWVRVHERVGGAVLLVLAGAFQFSALKYKCLDKCRSPLSLVLEYWQGVRPKWYALRLGLDSGAYCVGCCWALMLLMFLVGVHYLGWMLVLATLMAVEKNVPRARRMSAPLGVALILAGVILWALRLADSG